MFEGATKFKQPNNSFLSDLMNSSYMVKKIQVSSLATNVSSFFFFLLPSKAMGTANVERSHSSKDKIW